MAIAFGAAGTAIREGDTSIDVPYPSSISAGNILVLHVLTRDNVEINTPSDFNVGDARNQTTGLRSEWFWKRATGSESGTLTVTKASGATSFAARMYRYTGAISSGTPYEDADQGGATSATITPTDITTTGDGRYVVVLTAVTDDNALVGYTGGTATVPEEVAEFVSTTGEDLAIGVNGLLRTSAETFDFGTQVMGASDAHITFTFALLPETAATHSIAASLDITPTLADALSRETFIAASVDITPTLADALTRETFIAAALLAGMTISINLESSGVFTEYFIAATIDISPSIAVALGRETFIQITQDISPVIAAALGRETFLQAALNASPQMSAALSRETFIQAALNASVNLADALQLELFYRVNLPIALTITVNLGSAAPGASVVRHRTLLGVGL